MTTILIALVLYSVLLDLIWLTYRATKQMRKDGK